MPDTVTTAIIGAGLAGLTCARALVDAGQNVVIFDKGRGLGGRMAARRRDGWRFDHGAVALRPTTPEFSTFVNKIEGQGNAAHWDAGAGWVGVPGASALVKPLAAGLDIHTSVRVTRLHRTAQGWTLEGPDAAKGMEYQRVILAIPHPQAIELLAPFPAIGTHIAHARMDPCWTLMVGFDTALPCDLTYRKNPQGPICVIARETAKPARDLPGDAWVIQASADWSTAHLERDPEEIEALLLDVFFNEIGCAPAVPAISMAHRWRYAQTATALGQPFVMDADLGLAVCGDWCLGDTAQSAFESGRSLAAALA